MTVLQFHCVCMRDTSTPVTWREPGLLVAEMAESSDWDMRTLLPGTITRSLLSACGGTVGLEEGQTDGWTNGEADRCKEGRTDRQKEGATVRGLAST